jgi:ketosteroid isomerase-like protein
MDEARFQRWLEEYVDAWRTYDRAAIERLFADDAEYRYHPWDEPVSGRAAIVDDWLEDRDEPGSWTAEYRPWVVTEDRAVAVGITRYLADDGRTVEREYHNVFLCRFDDDGRCTEFTEVFLKRDL